MREEWHKHQEGGDVVEEIAALILSPPPPLQGNLHFLTDKTNKKEHKQCS